MKAVVIHSGGMDSSICLALAIDRHGQENVVSLSFRYNQLHAVELERAERICQHWGVRHQVVPISSLEQITNSALLPGGGEIKREGDAPASTEVVGRNGLMVRLGGIFAHGLGADELHVGVLGMESEHSGYRDCSRHYMDMMQEILRVDFGQPGFSVVTPLVDLTKEQTLEKAHGLGVLGFLLETTVTCYRGIDLLGCGSCPACELRNKSLAAFARAHPELVFSYRDKLLARQG